ncbi:MAG TPA: hypothetical protein VFB03_02245 [Candidatus Saccharimonadales bacterium]|nr:hypothetical protein [Candidatus Saccharimonadales bacterium]
MPKKSLHNPKSFQLEDATLTAKNYVGWKLNIVRLCVSLYIFSYAIVFTVFVSQHVWTLTQALLTGFGALVAPTIWDKLLGKERAARMGTYTLSDLEKQGIVGLVILAILSLLFAFVVWKGGPAIGANTR